MYHGLREAKLLGLFRHFLSLTTDIHWQKLSLNGRYKKIQTGTKKNHTKNIRHTKHPVDIRNGGLETEEELN